MLKLFEQWTESCNDVSVSHIRPSVLNSRKNGTVPYHPEPPGLCDDVSGHYLLQRVLNKYQTVLPLQLWIITKLRYGKSLIPTDLIDVVSDSSS
jgi:hypothetical protein